MTIIISIINVIATTEATDIVMKLILAREKIFMWTMTRTTTKTATMVGTMCCVLLQFISLWKQGLWCEKVIYV